VSEERFVEIDIARGIIICIMVILHFMWDLDFFKVYSLNNDIYQLNKIVAFSFLFIVGICLSFTNGRKTPLQQLKRGLWIFNIGMGLTIITLVFMPDRPILFGVLHCIGLSIVLSILFIAIKKHALKIYATSGIIFIATGFIIGTYIVANPTILQLIIGFHQQDLWRYTIDYFPLVPWFGIVLMGIVAGRILYKDGKRQFKIPKFIQNRATVPVSFLGKHSLPIYLVHQPIIIFLIKYIIIPLRPLLNI